jgi:hypothetical protein
MLNVLNRERKEKKVVRREETRFVVLAFRLRRHGNGPVTWARG